MNTDSDVAMTTDTGANPAVSSDMSASKVSTADLADASQRQTEGTQDGQSNASSNSSAVETRPIAGAQTQSPPAPLFAESDASDFRSRWNEAQTSFVDEPRQAVEQADTLVAEVMQRLAKTFADERSKLEGQWQEGEDISTEDLRLALQRYRTFFDRLLSV